MAVTEIEATQHWRDWANAPYRERTPRNEYDLPSRYYKRPRKGMILAGATGPELIIEVRKLGLELLVQDRNNRFFTVSRAPIGVWTILTTLRDYS